MPTEVLHVAECPADDPRAAQTLVRALHPTGFALVVVFVSPSPPTPLR
ncbi:hypothetical protein OKW52_15645 [Pararhodobacter zhoushanensis]|uniref:Uncharacterized protein n=1 Tax=Pararhodobacter zhoushanensis TaxID=2479545 RepID=A0ABT3H1I7_9RHOB|nr:hypothetical protein [Pararhodobacter zhoushanensis]MCW1933651.1 hypothetical protein [Pararhodobacter zhoushanensis]